MYQPICNLNDIAPNSGVAALVGDFQVAIFRLQMAEGEKLFAISNYDPFSQSNVLSRGIVGCLQGKPMVASPIYKQHFFLETGTCLEDESIQLKTWHVKLEDDSVLLFNDQAAAA